MKKWNSFIKLKVNFFCTLKNLTIPKQTNLLNKLQVMSNNEIQSLDVNEKNEIKEYYKILYSKHFNFQYQFTSLEYYEELLIFIQKGKGIIDLNDSLNILNDFIEYQLKFLINNKPYLLLNVVQTLCENKFGSYTMFYIVEEAVLKIIKKLDNEFLIPYAWALISNNQGSKYFYNRLSEELLLRKLSKLSLEQFILAYNTMSIAKIEEQMFWIIAEKANKEIFKVDDSLLLKPYSKNI